jgi:tetratricopeptide (TPR) repeat protein
VTRRAPRRLLATALVVVLGGWQPFRTADPDVEAGNQAYAEGRYAEALAAYDRAARRGGVDADGLAYDRGTAELKQSEAAHDAAEKQRLIQRALDDLKQAGHARDPRIRGSAHYNRGNLLMGQDKLDDAIEAYKQALREQPGLDDARRNLELALRKRQKQPRQRQQQGQQGGQGQQGQGQGQGQQGQGQQGQGQGSGSGSQGGSGDPANSQNGQSGQNGQNGPSGQSGDPPGQGQPQSGQNGQNGQGSGQPRNDQQNGQGSGQPQNGQQNPQRGRGQRNRGPQSPRTPTDGKLDDLDNYSRRLQKDEARRHATGRATDPQHDW